MTIFNYLIISFLGVSFCNSEWRERYIRAVRANIAVSAIVPLLKGETETADLQIRLVTDHLLTKIRRIQFKTIHGCNEEDKLTISKLLRCIIHINELATSTSTNLPRKHQRTRRDDIDGHAATISTVSPHRYQQTHHADINELTGTTPIDSPHRHKCTRHDDVIGIVMMTSTDLLH